MSFFKEWDFYYIPKTDYNPKWMNYKYKNKKLYDQQCIYPKATTSDKQWCNAKKVMPGVYNCNDCDGSGWSLWGKECWRSKPGCYNSYTYKYNSLCYNQNSACKPEMISHPKDFHCETEWNYRDLGYYQVGDDYLKCECMGGCKYGAVKVSTYDKSIFDELDGIGTTKIIKSVKLIFESIKKIYCDDLKKAFRVKIQLTKIKSWDVLDKLKTIFSSDSKNMDKSYNQFNYLNNIGFIIVEFYLMMNVGYDPNASDFELKITKKFSNYVPLFLVFNNPSIPALLDVDTRKTSKTDISIKTRNYSLNFYNSSDTLKTLDKTYVELSDGVNPESNIPILKNIEKQAIYLVEPIQFCIDGSGTEENININLIVYLIYYDMTRINEKKQTVLKDIKEKFIDNAIVATSPYHVWNKYVYYNHILPNICYDIETDSTYCKNIMNYDASPPSLVAQKCSLLTSKRFPDCGTYLVTNIEREQPKTNQIRTDTQIDKDASNFCKKNHTLDCQCIERNEKSFYKLFQNSSGFQIDSNVNDGCWYKPCMDDPATNILIPSNIRSEKINCPKTVCENIITVINRPDNSVNMSNLDLRTSCYILPTATPKPKPLITTPLPEEEEEEEEETTSPPPEETLMETEEDESGQIIPEEDVHLNYTTLYIQTFVFIIVFIILVSIFIIFLLRIENYGVVNIAIIIFLILIIMLIVFNLTQNIRLIFNISSSSTTDD